MIDWAAIGKKIRTRREEMGLSGQQLAELIDRSEPMISLYESGKNLSLEVCDRLAPVLGRAVSWFFESEDPRLPKEQDLSPKQRRALRRIAESLPKLNDDKLENLVRTVEFLSEGGRAKKSGV